MKREPQIFTTGQTTSKNGISVGAILLIKKKKKDATFPGNTL